MEEAEEEEKELSDVEGSSARLGVLESWLRRLADPDSVRYLGEGFLVREGPVGRGKRVGSVGTGGLVCVRAREGVEGELGLREERFCSGLEGESLSLLERDLSLRSEDFLISPLLRPSDFLARAEERRSLRTVASSRMELIRVERRRGFLSGKGSTICTCSQGNQPATSPRLALT